MSTPSPEQLGSLNAPQKRAVTYGEPLPGGTGFRAGPLLIVAGAGILVAVLDAYDLDEIEVSVRDLLDGVAHAAAALPEPVEGDAPPGAYTCC